MQPIVHGLEAKYGECVDFARANFHADSVLRRTFDPIGTPEFFLTDASGAVVHHWIGVTEAETLEAALASLCGAPKG
jgi:hypothetical protein